ncbi:MAG: glycerol kinase GlpK [Planctomycetota bacterium]
MYLALDQGTTSCRAFVFDAGGAVVSFAQREFAQHFPGEGRVEHDAMEILSAQLEVADRAVEQAGGEIMGVGIANQRETVVVWERSTGRPIHRAIVWQDRRTAPVLAGMSSRAQEVLEATGLPLDPYFSAAKIAWILDEVPGARAAAERGDLCAGTIDTWLLFHLTGGRCFATEPGNASRTSLYDSRTGAFSDRLCELFRVPSRCLPEILPSAGCFGEVEGRGWPLRAVLGDQQAALFGHGCTRPGEAKCTYGTGAFLLVQCGLDRPVPRGGVLCTVAWRIGDREFFALEGSVLVCGAAVQWLRDQLGLIEDAADVERLARTVADSGGLVFVPAFAGLGTPHWDPRARGLWIGLTRGTGRGHLARAVLEGMAQQVADLVEALQSDGRGLGDLRVDGGAARNDLLLELQAGLSGLPVVRPEFAEATAFGAFRMALLGADPHRSLDDLPAMPGGSRRFDPPAGFDRSASRARWREAVERARDWARP